MATQLKLISLVTGRCVFDGYAKLAKITIPKLHYSDHFGIDDVTNRDIAGYSPNKRDDELQKKFSPLLISRRAEANKEHTISAVYGSIRRDVDNVVDSHGKYDEDNVKPMFTTQDIRQMYMPSEDPTSSNQCQKEEREVCGGEKDETYYKTDTVIMSQVPTAESLSSILEKIKHPQTWERPDTEQQLNRPPLSFRFTYQINSTTTRTVDVVFEPAAKEDERSPDDQEKEGRVEPESVLRSYGPKLDEYPDLDPEDQASLAADDEIVGFESFDAALDEAILEGIDKHHLTTAAEHIRSIKIGKSAPVNRHLKEKIFKNDEDVAQFISGKEKLDSKGYRNFSVQVPDFTQLRKIELIQHLKRCIVYDNYDIVALNKPYGIACHGGLQSSDRSHLNLDTMLDELAKIIRTEKLYLVHRLDKNTTGILLLARTKERAQFLQKTFASGEVSKIYHCITKSVPEPPEGIIDIPIDEFTVDGKIRRCLRPEPIERMRQLTKKKDKSSRAVTEYKVLESSGSAALLEVKPKTGVRHQIRCHLGFGLRTPILGDHTYSHLSRVAPQKLPSDMLAKLKVRQAKVRTIPMHLHATRVVISGAKDGQNLFIKAPLPYHFVKNLKTLNLLTPEISERLVINPDKSW